MSYASVCFWSPNLVFNVLIQGAPSYLATWGRGNSTVVRVSVYQVGGPGLLPARSACHRKVEFYHCVIDSLPQVPTTG